MFYCSESKISILAIGKGIIINTFLGVKARLHENSVGLSSTTNPCHQRNCEYKSMIKILLLPQIRVFMTANLKLLIYNYKQYSIDQYS